MELFLPVILGTSREGRMSEHVAKYVHERLAKRAGITTMLVDPRELPWGNLIQREFEMKEPPPGVREFVSAMERADGFLVVTPEYNHSIPGALKNILDVTFKPWNRKPFAIIGCGGISGGLRAVEALRQVVTGLGAVSVPAHGSVQGVGRAFGVQGPLADAADWDERFDRVIDELVWYASALKPARLSRLGHD